MANFCTKCGSPLDSNAVFCPNCGAEIKNNSDPNTPKNNALLKVVFLIAGIIVLALIFSSIFGRSYRSVLDDLFEGIEGAEPDKIVRIMPDCEIEYLEKSLNEYDVYDSIEDYINASLGMMIKSLNMEYGDDISISYDILDEKELSDSKLKAIENELKTLYKSKDTEVSQGYKVKLDIVIKGDYKADKNTLTVDVAKVDGKWCLVENDFNSLF